MTNPAPIDPLEAFTMPAGAIELDDSTAALSARSLAVAALQRALRDRKLSLPLGPETALGDAQRLLSLNRFGVQLATAGVLADQLVVDAAPWANEVTAPQLLLAALVDEENAVVAFPGVLTGAEFIELARRAERSDQGVLLDPLAFRGGVDRLLSLVQLLEPEALPRLSLAPAAQTAAGSVVAVIDWLRGQLDEAFSALGGELTPVAAGAFRSFSAGLLFSESAEQALAMLVIPFGLSGDQLVSGDAARRCVRKFQLALIPTGPDHATHPTGLVVRLSSAVPGALLPDGLQLDARQGSHRQTITSAMSTELELVFQASDQLLDVSLRYGETGLVELPSLQLPS
jgi:hypothetical protein